MVLFAQHLAQGNILQGVLIKSTNIDSKLSMQHGTISHSCYQQLIVDDSPSLEPSGLLIPPNKLKKLGYHLNHHNSGCSVFLSGWFDILSTIWNIFLTMHFWWLHDGTCGSIGSVMLDQSELVEINNNQMSIDHAFLMVQWWNLWFHWFCNAWSVGVGWTKQHSTVNSQPRQFQEQKQDNEGDNHN